MFLATSSKNFHDYHSYPKTRLFRITAHNIVFLLGKIKINLNDLITSWDDVGANSLGVKFIFLLPSKKDNIVGAYSEAFGGIVNSKPPVTALLIKLVHFTYIKSLWVMNWNNINNLASTKMRILTTCSQLRVTYQFARSFKATFFSGSHVKTQAYVWLGLC